MPEGKINPKTLLVLKSPKTTSSVRKVFLPRTVAEMLVEWKKDQDEIKEAFGDEYQDYGLVLANYEGTPTEASKINKSFKKLIAENNLPPVVFHSLRHSSITYKLKLTGGDIKSVQGDSGHAQAKMVTDQYSHILDENRKENAILLENAFYNTSDCIDLGIRLSALRDSQRQAFCASGFSPRCFFSPLHRHHEMQMITARTPSSSAPGAVHHRPSVPIRSGRIQTRISGPMIPLVRAILREAVP